MASLVFNSTEAGLMNRTLDITSGTFYAHLVTAAPVGTNTTVADLTLASGGSYTPQVLAGRTIAADGTGTKLTFSDPSWSALYTSAATPIVGVVICKQVGGSPASTDPILNYMELSPSPYTPQTSSGLAQGFTFNIPTTGVLKLD